MTTPDDAESAVASLLESLGVRAEEDREVAETPRRVAALLRQWLTPVDAPSVEAIPADGMACDLIRVDAIPFHAFCAHHLVPFFGTVDIAYRPVDSIAGFGALPRLVDACARGPMLQERLSCRIADALIQSLQPAGVAVRIRARQMCVELSGRRSQPQTVTLDTRGCFDGDLRVFD